MYVRIAGAILAALILCSRPVEAQSPIQPTFQPAADGIFEAFKSHPLVGMGEYHGLAQQLDLYTALIRDPRFASEVGNVVVEFGGSAHQRTMDRYLAGEDVPYTQLRRAWTEVVGWLPTVVDIGQVTFFAQVRAVNAGLPPERRIRVWLGEPPIDWSKIKTMEDLKPLLVERDTFPAALIEREILGKRKKALVIYGSGHFLPAFEERVLSNLIKEKSPGALFIVAPYGGFHQKSCSVQFEKQFEGRSAPLLAAPIKGSTLIASMQIPGCSFAFPEQLTAPGMTDERKQRIENSMSGVEADALLYLGPSDGLVRGARMTDLDMDVEYKREIERRVRDVFKLPLPKRSPLSPIPYRQQQ